MTIVVPGIVLHALLGLDCHVAPDLDVYAFGYMLCAKLIRCHQTELISAATLACMGRPWLGLSVCSLMRITNVGRLCACDYPGPVNGDSLESRFGYIELSPRLGQLYPVWDNVVCHDGGRCLEDTGQPKTGCRVIR